MEKIAWVLLNPLAEFEVIVCGHAEYEEVNPLYLLLNFLGVLINNLPPKSECDENGEHRDTREYQGDVCYHFAEHGSHTILRILDIVNALE